MLENLKVSDYVTIVVGVPESHADKVREAMGNAGAGKFGSFSHGTFSIKGISRYRSSANKQGPLETLHEDRIETICHTSCLEKTIEAIKKAHPGEETYIDIYPVYQMAIKSKH
ncbi:MAG: hypothetical protein HYX48_02985 [Chlamydiales bacterium]|nr:hypothetical protein [Chlamydiales bacterium]